MTTQKGTQEVNMEQILLSTAFGVCIGVASSSPMYGVAAAIFMNVLHEIKYRLK